jgi:riboflavin synthase
MFTGIVAGLGTLVEIEVSRRRGGARLRVRPPAGQRRFVTGESICVSGVCLTAIRDGRDLVADLSRETLRRSTLGRLAPGAKVNVERALRWGDPLSGHFVMGHVEGIARVRSIVPSGNSWMVSFSIPRGLSRFVVPKGSVCVDGVSLTVASRGGGRFGVAVIPETQRRTTLGRIAKGDSVNFEADVFARYGHGAVRRAKERRVVRRAKRGRRALARVGSARKRRR